MHNTVKAEMQIGGPGDLGLMLKANIQSIAYLKGKIKSMYITNNLYRLHQLGVS